ncbi:MAG: hypothetical protein HQL32_17120 [Planctomycetes bacterium]|nr:hypothetical protein [Planctomycetota bacterium]
MNAFEKLASNLRAEGVGSKAEELEAAMSSACTTSSELYGIISASLTQIHSDLPTYLRDRLQHSFSESEKLIHVVWPKFKL